MRDAQRRELHARILALRLRIAEQYVAGWTANNPKRLLVITPRRVNQAGTSSMGTVLKDTVGEPAK